MLTDTVKTWEKDTKAKDKDKPDLIYHSAKVKEKK